VIVPAPPEEFIAYWPPRLLEIEAQLAVACVQNVSAVLTEEGLSVVLRGGIANGQPEPGTVALLLWPNITRVALIEEICVIEEPHELAPLQCGQQPLASYEINVTADAAYFCMSYRERIANITEPSISVWRFEQGAWRELPANKIWRDPELDRICGWIESTTPYMIAGFVERPPLVVTPEAALAAIRDANKSIAAARAWRDVSEAEAMLVKAIAAYEACQSDLAKELADRARAAVAPPLWIIALIIAAMVAVGMAYWRRLKAVVRPPRRRRRSRL
jgi:hypothetical protein